MPHSFVRGKRHGSVLSALLLCSACSGPDGVRFGERATTRPLGLTVTVDARRARDVEDLAAETNSNGAVKVFLQGRFQSVLQTPTSKSAQPTPERQDFGPPTKEAGPALAPAGTDSAW